ncbi:MAG: transketolase, partial [Spirochaetaceae bacterium]
EGYTFVPGKDDVIRTGSAGYVVAYGEMLYRALDAVERLRADGIDVGLINKTTLNVPDDDALAKVGATGLALVVETQNRQTGLGVRYGTWLLERGYSPRYGHLGTTRRGAGGLGEHILHQGLGPDDIVAAVKKLTK